MNSIVADSNRVVATPSEASNKLKQPPMMESKIPPTRTITLSFPSVTIQCLRRDIKVFILIIIQGSMIHLYFMDIHGAWFCAGEEPAV